MGMGPGSRRTSALDSGEGTASLSGRRALSPAASALPLCLAVAEPERAAGAHRGEGCLLPGRGHCLPAGQPARLRRG